MKNVMTKFFKTSLFSSIGLAMLGLLLIFQSEITIVSLSYIIGALLVGLGALGILNYTKNKENSEKKEMDLVYGTVCIVLGLVVIGNPQGIASLIPFVIGLVIIISSATKLQYSMELKKQNNRLWKSTMALSLVTMVCGLLLIFNPFQGAIFITKVIGILILIYALLDIISTITIKNTVNKLHKSIEEHIIEAEVIDESESIKDDEITKKEKKHNKSDKKSEKEDEE
jgi:uncharacterized membrane protein HdeD (DUF308 family)